MNFISSITAAFKDSFSSGLKDMWSSVDSINNALSAAMEQPSRIAGSLDFAFKNIQAASGAASGKMEVMRHEILSIGDGAASKIAAGTGMAAKTMLNVSSGALNAAAQIPAIAANISNAAPFQAINNVVEGVVPTVGGLFKSNVISPIMNSPVGGAVSKIAGITGVATKAMPDRSPGALNAAAQIPAIAANISNAAQIPAIAANISNAAPFQAISNVAESVFPSVGGLFKSNVISPIMNSPVGGAVSKAANISNAAPETAFNTSLQTVSRQLFSLDTQEGPLSTIISSGRALTDTFTSGMDETALREKANLVFSAAMPQGETIEFPANEVPAREAGSQTVHIQNLYLQADECQNIFDFVRMIMHSVNRPQEAVV